MKKSNPKEILFGYEKPINIKEQTEKYFRPLWHFHSEYEIVFIKESFGKKFIGDHIGEFKAGDLYFIGKQLPHMWVNDNSFFRKDIDKNATSLVLHFKLDFLAEGFISSGYCTKLNTLLMNSKRGLEINGPKKKIILDKLNELSDTNGMLAIGSLLSILEILASSKKHNFLSSPGYINKFVDYNSDRINKINSFIVENFRNKIRLKDGAEIANMNVTSFCRFFKQKTQKTFNQYLNDFRIGHAKRLLLHSDLSISQICFEIGFNNLANFNRHFKKKTMVSPRAYRNSKNLN